MSYIRKQLVPILIITLFLMNSIHKPVKGNAFDLQVPAPPTYSESIVVMDADTGVVLYDKQGDVSYMPASTTKVMTAILTIENLDLDQMVTVGPKPPFAEGSSMGFKEGEIIMVSDLLYSLLLQSANDAAEVLAEAISGTVEDFAVLMTDKAKQIGAHNTIFMNPSGLHVEGANNYTTAKDLALITAYASQYETLIEMGQVRSYMLPLTNLLTDMNRWVSNKNDLFKKNSQSYYEYTTFAKTGWTPAAGYAHTALGEKDGKRIIVSILKGVNQKTYWQETRELMDWAFNHTYIHPIYTKGQEIRTAILKDGKEISLVSKDDFYFITSEENQISPLLEFTEISLDKSYTSGKVIDVAKVIVNEKEIGTLDMICEDDIIFLESTPPVIIETPEEEPPSNGIKNTLTTSFSVIAILFVLMLSIRIYNVNRRRKRKSQSRNKMYALKKRESDKSRH